MHPLKTRSFYMRGYMFAPDVVFDVGVGAGTRWLYKTYPDARFVLVDPQERSAERSKSAARGFDFHAVALGASDGEAVLKIPRTDDGRGNAMASLFERTDRLSTQFEAISEETVPVRTLDGLAADYPGRVGLKIDTEGAEIEILKGATETLKRTDFVVLEVSVTRRFDNIPKPSQAVALLADAGLEMRDILATAETAGPRAKPRHMDVLFTRWAE